MQLELNVASVCVVKSTPYCRGDGRPTQASNLYDELIPGQSIVGEIIEFASCIPRN